MHSSMTSRLAAEFLGTFVLVFGGAGSAIFAASVLAGDNSNINRDIGFVGVTLGAVLAGRVEPAAVAPYWLAQLIGGVAAGGVLWVIASGKEGFSAVESGFATNGYGDLSPDGYSLAAVLIAETVLTAIFLYIILGATDRRAPQGFAPAAIGLALTLIHLISIPARSLGVAVYAGSEPRCSVPPSPASPTSSSSRTSRITSWRTSGPLPRSASARQVDRRYVPRFSGWKNRRTYRRSPFPASKSASGPPTNGGRP